MSYADDEKLALALFRGRLHGEEKGAAMLAWARLLRDPARSARWRLLAARAFEEQRLVFKQRRGRQRRDYSDDEKIALHVIALEQKGMSTKDAVSSAIKKYRLEERAVFGALSRARPAIAWLDWMAEPGARAPWEPDEDEG